MAPDNFLFNHPLGFSNFLITTSSPNFCFKISSALPNPSIKPSSFALVPDQNSPVNKSGIELFSGEFWSGTKAKELGLIDEVGNANEILREKFGEDVVIKKFEKSKGWLSKKLSASNNTHLDQLVNVLEERSIWQRYGF